jgi:HNH endonuclease/NUMOD4 motif
MPDCGPEHRQVGGEVNDLPEVWLPVVGYEGFYEVSSIGGVRSLARFVHNQHGAYLKEGCALTPSINTKGYRRVTLTQAGVSRTREVHRLVCLEFHGQPGSGQEVRHLDGDSLNNCASNLAWGTHSENCLDKVTHGTAINASSLKTHCPQDHAYDEENTYYQEGGGRQCRACQRRRAHVRAVKTRGHAR